MLIDQQDGGMPQNLNEEQMAQLQAMQQMYGAEDDYGEEAMEGYGEEEMMEEMEEEQM